MPFPLAMLAIPAALALIASSKNSGKTNNSTFRLVEFPGYGGKKIYLRNDAAAALAKLILAARRDGINGNLLLPFSGFRGIKEQTKIRARAEMKYGDDAGLWVAKPGSSSHHTGRVVDLNLGIPIRTDSTSIAKLRSTKAYLWMKENANTYGFYPYEREPWHWEYGLEHDPTGERTRAEIQRGLKEGYLT